MQSQLRQHAIRQYHAARIGGVEYAICHMPVPRSSYRRRIPLPPALTWHTDAENHRGLVRVVGNRLGPAPPDLDLA
eukprot:3693966-Rhodomonas_salina.2